MASVFLSRLSFLRIWRSSFDLVIALTGGGRVLPPVARDIYVRDGIFRGDLGQAASSAMVMMIIIFAIVVPYLYSELRAKHD